MSPPTTAPPRTPVPAPMAVFGLSRTVWSMPVQPGRTAERKAKATPKHRNFLIGNPLATSETLPPEYIFITPAYPPPRTAGKRRAGGGGGGGRARTRSGGGSPRAVRAAPPGGGGAR